MKMYIINKKIHGAFNVKVNHSFSKTFLILPKLADVGGFKDANCYAKS